jgi:GDP-L-fucose synthase
VTSIDKSSQGPVAAAVVVGQTSFVGKTLWVTGHKGMLGSAMVRSLANEGAKLLTTSRAELDLSNQGAVLAWMDKNRPQLVFHIGAKVGGIHANSTLPADFLLDNLMIQSNVIDGAHRVGVEKLVFVASNCIYPTNASQPISEDALLTGPLESHIRAYAVSKIAGVEMCRAYRRQHGCNFVSVVPPNLYGPGDNYHPQHSHVVAGILRRTHEAKMIGSPELVVWGDGTPRRELLHVDDLAEALKYIMRTAATDDLYNVGCGRDLTIAELATIISEVVGFNGKIVYDMSKPNGTMRKLLNNKRMLSLGWMPKIEEKSGLRSSYMDFQERLKTLGTMA